MSKANMKEALPKSDFHGWQVTFRSLKGLDHSESSGSHLPAGHRLVRVPLARKLLA